MPSLTFRPRQNVSCLRFVVMLPALFASIPCHAQAATYYVDPTSKSDALSASPSAPGSLAFAVANAPSGSTVILQDGEYDAGPTNGFMFEHSGVTFRAAHWHGAVVSNRNGFSLLNPDKGVVDNVVQGIVFGPAKRAETDDEWSHSWAGGGGDGWKFYDCDFNHNAGVGFGTNGLVEHCTFTDQYGNGLDVNGSTGFTFRNSMIRRANRANHWTTNDTGNKFDFVNNTTVDGLVSYDNVGCGLWFDTNCMDYVVKNSTFFANHVGEAWWGTPGRAGAENEHDGAIGFATEANKNGVSYILDNVFYNNEWAGLFYHDTGGAEGASVTIKGNRFYDSPIVFNAQGPGDGNEYRLYGNGKITHNIFVVSDKQPNAWITTEGKFEMPPSKQGMVFDYNTYCREPGSHASLAWYQSSDPGVAGISAQSLEDLQAAPLLLEPHGKTAAPPSLRGPEVNIYFWPPTSYTLKQVMFPNSDYSPTASIHQVNDDETPYIQRAIAGKKTGNVVTLTVFGHAGFTGSGPYECDVYDYSGRYVTLMLPNAAARDALDAAVPGWAVLKPYKIRVKLLSGGEYGLTAAFPAK